MGVGRVRTTIESIPLVPRIVYNQSILGCVPLFLKELRIRYGFEADLHTDEGVWYVSGGVHRWARLEHHVYGQDWKNLIERMESGSEGDRLECFDDLFPCLKREECNRQHVHNWISVFRFFHNLVRTREDDDDRPEYQRFIH